MAGGYTIDGRRQAALGLLVVGEDNGAELRRRIWALQDGRWALHPAVEEAAAAMGLNRHESETLLGTPITEVDESTGHGDSIQVEAFDDPSDGATWIPYIEVARVINSHGRTDSRHAFTWSNPVTIGQRGLPP